MVAEIGLGGSSGFEDGVRTSDRQSFKTHWQKKTKQTLEREQILAGFCTCVFGAVAPDQFTFAKKFGAKNTAELLAIFQEPDSEMLGEQLFSFAQRLEEQGKQEFAAEVYAALATPLPVPPPQGGRGLDAEPLYSSPSPLAGEGWGEGFPKSISKRAQARLNALTGHGHSGLRAEILLKNFSKTATDYRTIVPMLAGTAVFNLAKTAALGRLAGSTWRTSAFGAKLGAGAIGFGFELATFSSLSRGLHQLGGAPVAWDANSIGKELLSAAATLGTLKLSGWLGILPHPIPPLAKGRGLVTQAFSFLGLLGAHELEKSLGLRPEVDDATTLTDTLAAMLSLNVGAHLGRGLLGPRWAAFQAEMGLRTAVPRSTPPTFVVDGLLATSPPIRAKGIFFFSKNNGSSNLSLSVSDKDTVSGSARPIDPEMVRKFDSIAGQEGERDFRKVDFTKLPENAVQKARIKYGQIFTSQHYKQIDLSDVDLSGLDLRGVSFKRALTNGVKFKATKLQGAILNRCSLAGQDFSNFDLTFADLSCSNLKGAKFHRARLRHTRFYDVDHFSDASFIGADLTRSHVLDPKVGNLSESLMIATRVTEELGKDPELIRDAILWYAKPDRHGGWAEGSGLRWA